jgi:hypothetical protein
MKSSKIKKTVKAKAVLRSSQEIIDEIIESYDQSFVECFESYGAFDINNLDKRALLDNFKENYAPKTAGLFELDQVEAHEFLEIMDHDLLAEIIVKSSSEIEVDIYVQHNEMSSCEIGEHEHQIDICYHDELKEALEVEAAAGDQEAQERLGRGYFLAYGYPCDRMILKLDPKIFLENIRDPFLKAKSSGPKTVFGPLKSIKGGLVGKSSVNAFLGRPKFSLIKRA